MKSPSNTGEREYYRFTRAGKLQPIIATAGRRPLEMDVEKSFVPKAVQI